MRMTTGHELRVHYGSVKTYKRIFHYLKGDDL